MSTTGVAPQRAATVPDVTPKAQRRARRGVGADVLRSIVTGRGERVVIYVSLIVLSLLFLIPLYAAIAKSLEVNGFGNYLSLLEQPIDGVPIWQTYVNSIAIGAIHATVVLFVSTTAGYAFSRLRFRGRELGFSLVLLFLAVPGTAIIVPVYHITEQLNLFNNYVGVSLPEAALTIPFGVLLMRNYGRGLSDSMFEAASIDGAGHLRTFWSVFLPLARPAVVNLAILCFVWSLQDFLWPSFVFTNPKFATAAQAVQTFSNALGAGPAEIAKYNASLVLLAVPAALFVLLGLRFIINGFASGGSKE